MKTLLVRYTPRNAISKTGILLDAFRQEITNSEIEELDLCSDVPDLLTPEIVEAIYARNIYKRIPLDSSVKVLAKIDRMVAQLKSADVLVVAFPMFNFSMPAAVKAWFDSVMLVGETLKVKPFYGLMTGKKALALVSAGGIFSSGDGHVVTSGTFGPTWEHALSLAKIEFRRMGYSDIRGVMAEGTVVNATRQEVMARTLEEATEQIRAITQVWYGHESTKTSGESSDSQMAAKARAV